MDTAWTHSDDIDLDPMLRTRTHGGSAACDRRL